MKELTNPQIVSLIVLGLCALTVLLDYLIPPGDK